MGLTTLSSFLMGLGEATVPWGEKCVPGEKVSGSIARPARLLLSNTAQSGKGPRTHRVGCHVESPAISFCKVDTRGWRTSHLHLGVTWLQQWFQTWFLTFPSVASFLEG